jgi:hypothetical protein
MKDVNDEELSELNTEDFRYLRRMNLGIKSAFLNGCSKFHTSKLKPGFFSAFPPVKTRYKNIILNNVIL